LKAPKPSGWDLHTPKKLTEQFVESLEVRSRVHKAACYWLFRRDINQNTRGEIE
jgi:hypothetical protein